MTLKKHTDNARAFTFRHKFESVDHANVTSTAILGRSEERRVGKSVFAV